MKFSKWIEVIFHRLGIKTKKHKFIFIIGVIYVITIFAYFQQYRILANSTSSASNLSNAVRIFQDYPGTPINWNNNYPFILEVTRAEDQRRFLVNYGDQCHTNVKAMIEKYDEYDKEHQHELWKYCVLAIHGGAYIDKDSPWIKQNLDFNTNYAILGTHFDKTIHGSFLYFNQRNSSIALDMIRFLMDTKSNQDPLWIQKKLYQLISSDVPSIKSGFVSGKMNNWVFLNERCSQYQPQDEFTQSHPLFDCPSNTGYCCEIIDPRTLSVIMVTSHITLPTHYMRPLSELNQPYGKNQIIDPFISTISETIFDHPETKSDSQTPNIYEMLNAKNCLPSKSCYSCLKNYGSSCDKCKKQCSCYCDTMCTIEPTEKFYRKQLHLSLPYYKKDASRLIPRIIHQTWFEPITPEKYPNMSRLIQSWKQSGWEYRFYNDQDAQTFLSDHFPPEIKEAYDTLIPGAFKADLFRYCVLLINGGVYADMDIMLESNLDAIVLNDIGFMIPVDIPGKDVEKRMCLWNGLIASAPGHPFLARVLELIVNNIRNRFTRVDIVNLYCPSPELYIPHKWDLLFTTGPCILGTAINHVLRRHLQTGFIPGDLDIHEEGRNTQGPQWVLNSDDMRSSIPGRTVILKKSNIDMGAQRFTFLEKNMIVAATDMPDYDDRKQLKDGHPHYSKAHGQGIYGVENVYHDNYIANENIRISIK